MKVTVREHGTRSDLTDRDGVEQLRLCQPAKALHEVGAKEREQHVAASKEHRADLCAHEKER